MNSSFLVIDRAEISTSKSPLSTFEVVLVCSKDKVFFFPKELNGDIKMSDAIKAGGYFVNNPVEEGLKNIISEASNDSELEETLTNLLKESEKYIINLNTAKRKSIKRLWFQRILYVKFERGWITISPKRKEAQKTMASFYRF